MISLFSEFNLLLNGFGAEISNFFLGVQSSTGGHIILLAICLLLAFAFEFVNGFHDTANAVATVIYTNSLKPWPAVILAGICNFLGVLIGGTVVAMAIIKLIPADLIASTDLSTTVAFIFSMLIAAVIWNLGTWYFGIPASSSHTLIGSILGIGMGHSLLSTGSIVHGVNWSKAADVGLALFISPLVGFTLGASLLFIFKAFFKDPKLHTGPQSNMPPPTAVRATLIATCTGVSFAHGSNDGQKGVGLVMLILIALLPAQFALRPDVTPEQIRADLISTKKISALLNEGQIASRSVEPKHSPTLSLVTQAHAAELSASNLMFNKVNENLSAIESELAHMTPENQSSGTTKLAIRHHILLLDGALSDIKKTNAAIVQTPQWREVEVIKKKALSLTDYVPLTVLVLVALCLGLGTTIGWKRIVITIGEKIGNGHLTYAQGAAAEVVAMSTIGLSTFAGFPVSTTHILSSGVAGTMVANRSGVQSSTIKKILSAWILTLPVTILLSASCYCFIVLVILKA